MHVHDILHIYSIYKFLFSFPVSKIETDQIAVKISKFGEILHSLFEGENVRGSSTALSLYYLNQMKGLDCGQLTSNFRQKFVDNYFGVRLVKEYPDIGGEDFDSGPIIFGYGAVASIVNIKLMTKIGENPYPTLCLFNLLGIPISTWSYKFYLFEQEPMFDIFMLWNFVSID